jgi:hypothetical protein
VLIEIPVFPDELQHFFRHHTLLMILKIINDEAGKKGEDANLLGEKT